MLFDYSVKVSFYLIEDLEVFLPKLLEKIYSQKKRTLVVCKNEEQMNVLDAMLWTRVSFLPHGTCLTFDEATQQPIWIGQKWENLNQAEYAVVLNETIAPFSFEHVIDLAFIEPLDRIAIYKEKGFEVHYWKKTPKGGWYDSFSCIDG